MLAHSNSDGPEIEIEAGYSATIPAGMLETLEGSLIVSCQAETDHPMRDTEMIARLAASALLGGATALRINSQVDVRAVRASTGVPIIGLDKQQGVRRSVITASPGQASDLVAAGADIVAVDSTFEIVDDIAAHLSRVAEAARVPIMADVSTLDEGLRSWDAGAAFVGTTLAGYTPYTLREDTRPDIELVAALAARGVRVIAEGRYTTPVEVAQAFDAGAFAVVVGGAITDPAAITRRFVAATPRAR